jgi:hypothetical protein
MHYSRDPMDFTAVAIKSAKVPLRITKLAVFYFFVMCDAHQAVASSIERELPSTIKGDTHTISNSSAALFKSKPKPKRAKVDKVDDMSCRLSLVKSRLGKV